MKKIIFSLLFILSASAFGQSLTVLNIDTTNFPTLKANFFVFDSLGNHLSNFTTQDFEVKENILPRLVTNVSCPQNKPPEGLSSVLVIDVSGSMAGEFGRPGGGLDIAKSVANAWIDKLNLGYSDCAITSFSGGSFINRDFTTNRDNLINGINSLQTIGGTDYNPAFLDPYTGAIAVAKTGKHKRIIVFLSDGQPNFEPRTSEIVKQAKENNITIYCITIGLAAPECMKEFAKQTGGLCIEKIKTKEEALVCYSCILAIGQGTEPCQIEWQSEVPCESVTTNLSINYLPFNITYYGNYSTHVKKIAKLQFSTASLILYNSTPGIVRDTIINLTAKNSDINITNIISSNPAFTFDKTSFLIPKNQSVDLKISYLPKDSEYVYAKFSFETDLCPAEMSAVSFFKGRKANLRTIKLTKPNGGEEYLVGSDNIISWEGLPETDSVSLDYSIDGGKIWKKIKDKTPGPSYNWINIPPPTSDSCLVRVTHVQNASNVQIEWQKCLGGGAAVAIQQTNDDGFIVLGNAVSGDSAIVGNHGDSDFWVVKLNPLGAVEWQKCLGGTKYDYATSIQQTTDCGFIITGYTQSTDGDVIGNHGAMDAWVVKLDSSGLIEWQKCLGGTGTDYPYSIQQTSEGGFIVAGRTSSYDGDVVGNHGGAGDILVVKLNSLGNIEWQKCLGGGEGEGAESIRQTVNGGFIVAGYTSSNDGDLDGSHVYGGTWFVQLDSAGLIEWQNFLKGCYGNYVTSIQQTTDGGFIVAGMADSIAGDVSRNRGSADAWVAKLDSKGSVEWQKCFGGSAFDNANSIQQTSEGGFIFAGLVDSNDGDVKGYHGSRDAWVVKLNSSGGIEWQKCLGGSHNEEAASIRQTKDGGFIVAGYTNSNDGDVTENHGGTDAWIIKLSADGSIIQQDESDAVFSIVEPKATAIGVDMGKCLVGASKDSVVTEFTRNAGSYKCRIDSIYIQGSDAGAFKLIGGFPKYELDKGSAHFAEFDFSPTEIRFYAAEIVVLTQTDTLIVPITGECVPPQLNIICGVLDLGKVELGNETLLTDISVIKNISIAPISITKIMKMSPDLEQFDIISGGDPVVLNPGETHKMTLRFKPKFGGRTSGRIGFEYNGTGSPVTATLFGTGIGGVVASPSDSAYSGQKTNISLVLKNVKPSGLQAMAKSFSANLKFQGSILAPQDFSLVQQFKNDSITMRVSGDLPNDSTILSIPMIAGLGNVEETTIEISDFKLYDNSGAVIDYDMEVEYGAFKVLGICREGGTRLVNPNAQAQILSVRPNPATNAINIEYQLAEKGGAEFLLINDLGETVKQISYGEISDYTQRLETIKLDDLANGRYTLILKTPTISETRSVLVVK